MSIFISRPDLWEKLLEQKKANIDNELPHLVNLGINQAIGIMNRMPAFTYDPKEMEREIQWRVKHSEKL